MKSGRILGLTHLSPYTHYFHDSSAAMIRNGRVEAAAAEERFTRIPHYAGYPAGVIDWLLGKFGGSLSDCDAVALAWADPLGDPAFGPPVELRPLSRVPKIPAVSFIDHQRAHAFSAFAYAPFDDGFILTLDGMGLDGGTVTGGSVYRFYRGAAPELVHLIARCGATLGEFYGAVTIALGWEMLKDEGKTMALAAYGDPSPARESLRRWTPKACGVRVTGPSLGLVEHGVVNGRHLLTMHGAAKEALDEIVLEYGREAAAAAAQDLLEEEVLRLAHAATGGPPGNLCTAGGLFLNIHLVRRLREAGYNVFAYPNPGDGGAALGAALACHYDLTGCDVRQSGSPVYLGPSFTDREIEAAFEAAGVPWRRLRNAADTAAQLLARGVVIGLFQGPAEWGPRALGNRSVLADPRFAPARERLNRILKKRECFQPFGPMMTREAAGVLLENPADSPFMIDAFHVNEQGRRILSAVVHEDGTVRPQILRPGENPFCEQLLGAFGKRAGVEALINTSLNIHGEAMCLTPQNAIHLWRRGCIDALMAPPYVVADPRLLESSQ